MAASSTSPVQRLSGVTPMHLEGFEEELMGYDPQEAKTSAAFKRVGAQERSFEEDQLVMVRSYIEILKDPKAPASDAMMHIFTNEQYPGDHFPFLNESYEAISDLTVSSPGKINYQDYINRIIASDKKLLLLPIVLKSKIQMGPPSARHLQRHIVAIIIDKEKGRIEYYDPQGKELSNEGRKILNLEITPRRLIRELQSALKNSEPVKLVDEEEFVEIDDRWITPLSNVQKHQTDSHNCGIFVHLFLKERSKGSNFETLSSKKSPLMQPLAHLRQSYSEDFYALEERLETRRAFSGKEVTVLSYKPKSCS